jgi:hypothetical protein
MHEQSLSAAGAEENAEPKTSSKQTAELHRTVSLVETQTRIVVLRRRALSSSTASASEAGVSSASSTAVAASSVDPAVGAGASSEAQATGASMGSASLQASTSARKLSGVCDALGEAILHACKEDGERHADEGKKDVHEGSSLDVTKHATMPPLPAEDAVKVGVDAVKLPTEGAVELGAKGAAPGGIGLTFKKSKEGEHVVASIKAGGAADESGAVFVGDKILEVDGRAVRLLNNSEVEGCDEIGCTWAGVA